MELSEYKIKKEKGLIDLVNIGGKVIFVQKRFDPQTGETIEPETQAISLKDLETKKLQLLKQLQDLEDVCQDVKAFEENVVQKTVEVEV